MSATDWIAAAACALLALWFIGYTAWFIRREGRANDAWLESMRAMGRRCPACQPWGGWYLGAMREDGSYEVIDCELCGGTGQLPDDERVLTAMTEVANVLDEPLPSAEREGPKAGPVRGGES